MDDASPDPPPRAVPRVAVAAMVVAVLAIAGALLVYAMGAAKTTVSEAASCPGTAARIARVATFSRGDVAALEVSRAAEPAPALSFKRPDGESVTLADFHGRTVLVNLWATWCIPCRQEMPALDRLQGEVGGPNFEVVAIDIDTARLDKPKAFLDEAGVTQLARYADPSADVFQVLQKANQAAGLPTSLLVDPNGCELGIVSGPADWASADARALIGAALN